MRICIAAVGQRMPAWADAAVQDFTARMPRDFQVELREVRAEPRKGQGAARMLAAEAQRLRTVLPARSVWIAMDEAGEDWTSARFAAELGKWRDEALDPAFLIGGPDGLDPALKGEAVQCLRLSRMTLPHALARIVLVEQIYRAWSILASHPYHRA